MITQLDDADIFSNWVHYTQDVSASSGTRHLGSIETVDTNWKLCDQ